MDDVGEVYTSVPRHPNLARPNQNSSAVPSYEPRFKAGTPPSREVQPHQTTSTKPPAAVSAACPGASAAPEVHTCSIQPHGLWLQIPDQYLAASRVLKKQGLDKGYFMTLQKLLRNK